MDGRPTMSRDRKLIPNVISFVELHRSQYSMSRIQRLRRLQNKQAMYMLDPSR